jgi:hypothetical protein
MAGSGTVLQAVWQTGPPRGRDRASLLGRRRRAGHRLGKSAVTALSGSTEEAQFKIETVEVSAATAEPRRARAVPC